jgi:hypothetical protein
VDGYGPMDGAVGGWDPLHQEFVRELPEAQAAWLGDEESEFGADGGVGHSKKGGFCLCRWGLGPSLHLSEGRWELGRGTWTPTVASLGTSKILFSVHLLLIYSRP